ncbi:MAG: ATP-binding cassette domain-containing protein [Clostridia bacterium]|nr:ATP-binding cassette domain-containing protein [Clostridia bacterium]
MLTVSNVTKIFNPGTINEKVAINDLSITFHDGDFITVIGGNGAGKSTLMNLISGVYPIDAGSIQLNGKEISRLPEHKRAKMLGRVFQDPMMGTAADMEIQENLALAYRRGRGRGLKWGISHKEKELFKTQLARLGLGLEDRMTSKVGLLSGGQRQAITLLMATLQRPELLLLDEHTAALDPVTARKVLELSEELISEAKLTTMMVTHNMKDAIAHGNRLIMMNAGKIIFDISGVAKQRLTVDDLMHEFAKAGGEDLSDRALLS